MKKVYQNVNSYGTTTMGIIIDDKNKTYIYYPTQSAYVCNGKKVTKKRILELVELCIAKGYTTTTY